MRLERTSHGLVIHSALQYDLRAALRALGRDRAFRRCLVELARVRPGESVLDVGCATGSLALAAKRTVGAYGSVTGIDPSPAMVARARGKARRVRRDVTFDVGVAQQLPYPDGAFDVVLSTLVLHHMPHADLQTAIVEMRRVLTLGGRLLFVDIDPHHPDNPRSTPHRHAHGRGHGHGVLDLRRIVSLVADSGFEVVDEGTVPFRLFRLERLHYVLGTSVSA